MKRLLTMGSCGIAVLALSTAPASAAEAVTPLGGLEPGALSGAWGVNAGGTSVGWSNIGTTSHAVKWVPGQPVQDLGTLPGGQGSGASAINDNGVVAGRAYDSTGAQRAVKWSAAGVVTELGTPGGFTGCEATAINDSEVVAGECTTAAFTRRAVRWSGDGTATVLTGLAGGTTTRAKGINSAGQVAGSSNKDGGWRPNAVVWNADGSITELLTLPGADYGEAHGINDHGQVSGRNYVNFQYRGVRWEADNTGVTALGSLPGAATAESLGRSIASDGTVVGDSRAADGRYVGVFWAADGTATRLATLPGVPQGTVDFATATNSGNLIVGSSGGNAVTWTGYR